jgi:hypothetical protein
MYSVIEISNPTSWNISYRLKWGQCGQWTRYHLEAGERLAHSWEGNRYPVPSIEFVYNLTGCNVRYRAYQLAAYASPFKGFGRGKRYEFGTYNNGTILDLRHTN